MINKNRKRKVKDEDWRLETGDWRLGIGDWGLMNSGFIFGP